MHTTMHTTQVFSPFGGGYLPENHGGGLALGAEEPSLAGWATGLVTLLIGVTTGAVCTVTQGVSAALH